MTFRDCTSSGTAACEGISAITDDAVGGVAGDTTASASLGDATRGVTGTANLLGNGASSLYGKSTSVARTRDTANLVSLQRYTYAGASPAQATFSASLAFDQTVPDENAAFSDGNGAFDSVASGYIAVFTIDDDAIDIGPTEIDNFNTLFLGGIGSLAGFDLLGQQLVTSPLTTAQGVLDFSLTFGLQSGASYWLYSSLQTPAVNGAMVEGWLDTRLSVPEPGSLALAGLCLVALAASRRRKAA